MNQKQQEILTCLLANSNVTMNELQRKTSIHPRILRTHLDDLRGKKLIIEDIDSSWKSYRTNPDNRPRKISLTKKGQKECITLLATNFSQGFEALKSFVTGVLSKQSSDGYSKQKEVSITLLESNLSKDPQLPTEAKEDPWILGQMILNTLQKPLAETLKDLNSFFCQFMDLEASNHVTIIRSNVKNDFGGANHDQVHVVPTAELKEYTDLLGFLDIQVPPMKKGFRVLRSPGGSPVTYYLDPI